MLLLFSVVLSWHAFYTLELTRLTSPASRQSKYYDDYHFILQPICWIETPPMTKSWFFYLHIQEISPWNQQSCLQENSVRRILYETHVCIYNKCMLIAQDCVKFRGCIAWQRLSYFHQDSSFSALRSRGGTHIFGRTGMCRSNGSLFYKKSLNMFPVFYQKIVKHGSTFLTEPKFLGFRMAKTLKIVKFLKNGPSFQEKSLKMGTLFCQNHP